VPLIDSAGKARKIDGMAKKQVVTITDDIDGREGAQTVSFAFAGRTYEIDLRDKNRAKLEKALEPFISAARKVNGSSPVRRPPARAATASSGPDRDAVRAWAVEHGFEVSHRGRLSTKVVEAYQQAH
jgi:hypothetical protein